MTLRALNAIFFSCLFCLISWVFTPPAHALTKIKLDNLFYEDCPAEFARGNVTSTGNTGAANCFIVKGKAKNSTRNTVYDADIFGRIYDANGNTIFENRSRLGSIPEVPPGISDFQVRISVAATQPLPLQLKNFKASGFSARVRPVFTER